MSKAELRGSWSFCIPENSAPSFPAGCHSPESMDFIFGILTGFTPEELLVMKQQHPDFLRESQFREYNF